MIDKITNYDWDKNDNIRDLENKIYLRMRPAKNEQRWLSKKHWTIMIEIKLSEEWSKDDWRPTKNEQQMNDKKDWEINKMTLRDEGQAWTIEEDKNEKAMRLK